MFNWLRSVFAGKIICITPDVFGSSTLAPAVFPFESLTKFNIVQVKCTSLPWSAFPSLSRVAIVVSVVLALYVASNCAADTVGVGIGVGASVGVGISVGVGVGAWLFCVVVVVSCTACVDCAVGVSVDV